MQGKKRVLILGDSVSAVSIQRQLFAVGWDAISQKAYGFSASSLADDALLKNVLLAFVQDSQKGYAQLFVHPGFSRWSQRPDLESIAALFDVQVIGCSPRLLSLFTNYFCLLMEAQKSGLNHLVEKLDPMMNVREVKEYYEQRGHQFPFILKASHGTGNTGLFIVHHKKNLDQDLNIWIDRIRAHNGEVMLFAEQYLYDSRAIICPFARFANGEFYAFPFVDASLQSRFRKCIEICPENYLTKERKKMLLQACEDFAEQLHFVGVGAFEFLVDANAIYSIGGVARLNTQFELWETIAGTQAVHWQLATLGFLLKKPKIEAQDKWSKKIGFSCRIYAEDSWFLYPRMGEVKAIHYPQKWNQPESEVQLLLGVKPGDALEVMDSGILGFLNVVGDNLESILQTARMALSQLRIMGTIQTNQKFLMEVLHHPWVCAGVFCCGFLDEDFIMAPIETQSYLAASFIVNHFLNQKKKIHPATVFIVGHQKKIKSEELQKKDYEIEVGSCTEDVSCGTLFIPELQKKLSFFLYRTKNGQCFYVHLDEQSLLVRVFYPKPTGKSEKVDLFSIISGKVSGPYYMESSVVQQKEVILDINVFGFFVSHRVNRKTVLQKIYCQSQAHVEVGDVLVALKICP